MPTPPKISICVQIIKIISTEDYTDDDDKTVEHSNCKKDVCHMGLETPIDHLIFD